MNLHEAAGLRRRRFPSRMGSLQTLRLPLAIPRPLQNARQSLERSVGLRPCLEPGCSELVERGRCQIHSRENEKALRDPRLRGKYRSKRWKRRSRAFLSRHPECNCGCGKLAEVVDHVIPINLTNSTPDFFDESNWQGLTRVCHNRKTRRDVAERNF